MTNYDKYYSEDKNYFGNPHQVLINFLKSQSLKGSLVDLGAGQGRNSIPLTDLGYQVTAVDISEVGLEQIKLNGKNITTLCADIYTFEIEKYDFILMDSMLHFYKNDIKKETALVNNILKQMKPKSIFVNCMIRSRHSHLMNIIRRFDNLKIIADENFLYNENCKYHMLAITKCL